MAAFKMTDVGGEINAMYYPNGGDCGRSCGGITGRNLATETERNECLFLGECGVPFGGGDWF